MYWYALKKLLVAVVLHAEMIGFRVDPLEGGSFVEDGSFSQPVKDTFFVKRLLAGKMYVLWYGVIVGQADGYRSWKVGFYFFS